MDFLTHADEPTPPLTQISAAAPESVCTSFSSVTGPANGHTVHDQTVLLQGWLQAMKPISKRSRRRMRITNPFFIHGQSESMHL